MSDVRPKPSPKLSPEAAHTVLTINSNCRSIDTTNPLLFFSLLNRQLNMQLRIWPLLLLSWLGTKADGSQKERPTSEQLASIYEEVFFSYPVWPPLSKNATVWKGDATHPIDVVLGMVFVSVDTIDPGSSSFTVTSRNMLYYKEDDCKQTEVHQDACDRTIADRFKFLRADRASGSSTENMRLDLPDVHSQAFASSGLQDVQPSAVFVDNQITYQQSFDMRNYPFEFHDLEVSYSAAYSSNVVKLSEMPSVDPGILNPSVPPGWKLENVECKVGRSAQGRAISEYASDEEGGVDFYNYQCKIQVSRENTGWWITSFLLFSALIVIAFIGGLGVTSRYVADARDDKEAARRAIFDGTRVDGTFTVGLLLTFVFQVELSPYGQPIEYWPSIPTSTFIYVLGLVGITSLSASGLIGSVFSTKMLKAGGFEGTLSGPYDMKAVPKEGADPEEEMPLVLRKDAGNEKDLHSDLALVDESIQMVRSRTPDTEVGTTGTAGGTLGAVARARKNNQKMYTVLSVEEAIQINKFVRGLLAFKVVLLSLVFLAATIILSVARANHNSLIRNASQ